MFQQYMRNALLLLMEDAKYESATLMDVPRVFTDRSIPEKEIGTLRQSGGKRFLGKGSDNGRVAMHRCRNITPLYYLKIQ